MTMITVTSAQTTTAATMSPMTHGARPPPLEDEREVGAAPGEKGGEGAASGVPLGGGGVATDPAALMESERIQLENEKLRAELEKRTAELDESQSQHLDALDGFASVEELVEKATADAVAKALSASMAS